MAQTASVEGTQDFWRVFTTDTVKVELYQQEQYLAQGLDAAQRALGSDYAAILQGLAVLVIQADVIAARKVELCMQYARDHDFEPIVAVPFVMEPQMTAATWRFQFDMATDDSLELCDLYCAKSESLLVILADRSRDRTIPASLRLAELKGPSAPERRTERNLRTVLGAPNQIVCAVHCSDEPLDILRETAILLPDRLLDLFVEIADVVDRGIRPDIDEKIAAVYRSTPRHDMDVDHAVARLLSRLPQHGADPREGDAIERLRANLPAWQRRERLLSWPMFTQDLRSVGIDPHSWDALLVGSEYVEYDRVGGTKTLAYSGHAEWEADRGRLLAP
ncbi:hypothetical protein [Micromonospora ureilytica]|uniref:Nucleoside diphosphate kinase-like domain-containing protein n=1 Tax=Micromonospora ureilytica TaxID=709868 RepID=A0ABS0JBY7_9ACTN|nr:hypothetical protein [Micromonospora ureilytica]MBG6064464.1 hypothetical protein [Micromonospora ureilytica]WSR55877.1 hypothetical protein OG400_29560 [Micromonospora ureilytica]